MGVRKGGRQDLPLDGERPRPRAVAPGAACGKVAVLPDSCQADIGRSLQGGRMKKSRRTPQAIHAAWKSRMINAVRLASIALTVMLGAGVVGYHYLCELPWIDALLNASMILGGMGPIDPIGNDAGKIFASAYALLSGLVFVAVCGVLVAPFAHRFLHRFHAELEED
jgi:hypothetical protein